MSNCKVSACRIGARGWAVALAIAAVLTSSVAGAGPRRRRRLV